MEILVKFLIKCLKYLTVLKDKVQHELGKLIGELHTLLVIPYREWLNKSIRNWTHVIIKTKNVFRYFRKKKKDKA